MVTAFLALLGGLLGCGAVLSSYFLAESLRREARCREELLAARDRALAVPELLAERNAFLAELDAREAEERRLSSELSRVRDRERALELEVEALRARAYCSGGST